MWVVPGARNQDFLEITAGILRLTHFFSSELLFVPWNAGLPPDCQCHFRDNSLHAAHWYLSYGSACVSMLHADKVVRYVARARVSNSLWVSSVALVAMKGKGQFSASE